MRHNRGSGLTAGAVVALLLLIAALGSGCGEAQDKSPAKKKVLKVSVLQSGEILADGVEVSMAELDARFAETRRAGGSLWLHRELKRGAPPAETIQVLNLTVQHALLIRTSSKPDFSDLAGK